LNLIVLRNGELIGNSDEGRIALGAGRHELELRNDSVGYRAVMSVEIPRGRVVTLPVELPQSTLDINATPSARVWIDGRTVGNAPLTQIALPVGPHEVRFEHPDYGEKRVTVLVRVGATAQATVDFTKQ
jgi:PEGA domain